MGGQAFASGLGAVFTPRMRPNVYRVVRHRCQEKLRELYVVVVTPIEGPAKTSFGDVDLLVAWKRDEIFPRSRPSSPDLAPKSRKEEISQVLGAIRSKSNNARAVTLAIPWPSDIPYGDDADDGREGEHKDNNNEDEKPRCIQVDVHVCDTLSNLEWLLFRNAHGDLWNLLGSIIRPFGLTVDELGLHVRIPEIEAIDKKKARVLLSTNPAEVLGFLGLGLACDGAPWAEPFASDEDLFEYVATCWLFRVKPEAAEGGGGGEEGNEGEKEEDPKAMTEDKWAHKANDRRRMRSRPLFRKWITEYIPACRASNRFTSAAPSRDSVRERAFARFPELGTIYEARRATFLLKQQRQAICKVIIKGALPADMDPHRRGCCTSALKKLILDGHHDSGHVGFADIVAADPCDGDALRRRDGLFDERLVREWVDRNWRGVMDVAWNLNQQRMRENQERMREKHARADRERAAVPGSGKGADGEEPPAAEQMDMS